MEKISSAFMEAHKSLIRDSSTQSEELRRAIELLGNDLGREIMSRYGVVSHSFTTPMGVSQTGNIPSNKLTAIITTNDDFNYLGKGISSIFQNSIRGSMNFRGLRGVAALNADIRDIELPDAPGPVHTLIIGKSVLATGCTAISLTKSAMKKYMPRNVVIASIFYSQTGILELEKELPSVDLFVIGEADQLNEEGMLMPGVGNLDARAA